MDYLHYDFKLKKDEVVKVILNKIANVKLLDDKNFANYTNNAKYSYLGGRTKDTETVLTPPGPGHWHLVIDYYEPPIRANVKTGKRR